MTLLVALIYNKALENILLIRSDTNVRNELTFVDALLGLSELNVERTSQRRFKSRNFYGQSIDRQASATGYYFVNELNLSKWLEYRNNLLENYSAHETIHTGCDSNTDKTSSCEYNFSRQEGEEVFKKDWDIANRAHMSCYQGQIIDGRQLTMCLSVSPDGPYQYSEYSEDFNTPKHNVVIRIVETSPSDK